MQQLTTVEATAPAERTAAAVSPRVRLASIDIVRGLVIALMVLDHSRDFLGSSAISPTDLSRTNTALFFTRWVTHYCAPAFVFLAGTSARLASQRMSAPALRRFLVTRGLWLVLLECTVVYFAWNFNLRYEHGVTLQVIWAIGVSMLCLGVLTWLPERAILACGIALVALHNLLDPIAPEALGALAPLWHVLHVPGQLRVAMVVYPLIPWVGVMALGYTAGALFQLPEAERRKQLVRLGGALSLAFVALRGLNAYGDPRPWTPQPSAWFTFLSFLNVTKYPPSLAYVLMTLGPVLLALAACERTMGPISRALCRIGQVPLFAYVGHLLLVHALAGVLGLLSGYGTTMLAHIFIEYPPSWGFGLGSVYLAWLLVLALIYPACAWFARIKRERPRWWLSYL